jgi:hypothetical protein
VKRYIVTVLKEMTYDVEALDEAAATVIALLTAEGNPIPKGSAVGKATFVDKNMKVTAVAESDLA